ncbi:MAG: cardiolipin synthase [Candidatus Izemoplasmatales bacterium]
MKRIFVILALGVVGLFVYTLTLVQYTYVTSLASVFRSKTVLYIMAGMFWFLALGVVIRVLLKSSYAYNKSYWILIIVLNPILGVFLYYIFARDFQTHKFWKTRPLIAKKAFLGLEEITQIDYESYEYGDIFKFISTTTGRAIYKDDTYVEILDNGDKFFPRLMKELELAKDYIFMEFYIVKNDNIGKKVLDILKKKAIEGVDVYLIYDHFGSNKHLQHRYMVGLKKAGVKIGVFDPQTISIFNSNVNFRNHRKSIVIDGVVGFIGGMNLGDEYNHQDPKFGFWRDTHVFISGNGVSGLQNVFVKDWYYITGDVLDKPLDKTKQKLSGFFSVIESGPDFENGLIKDVYLKMIARAKKNVKIVTPYLIIEPEILSALKIASKSGIKIELLLPGKHDYFTVGFATQSYYEQLLLIGVKIYEYTNTFVHSKILIIDDKVASVGSVNLDPRSFHLNFEVTSVFENDSVDDLVKSFINDISKSKQVELKEWQKRGIIKRIVQGWFNLFSPMF